MRKESHDKSHQVGRVGKKEGQRERAGPRGGRLVTSGAAAFLPPPPGLHPMTSGATVHTGCGSREPFRTTLAEH